MRRIFLAVKVILEEVSAKHRSISTAMLCQKDISFRSSDIFRMHGNITNAVPEIFGGQYTYHQFSIQTGNQNIT